MPAHEQDALRRSSRSWTVASLRRRAALVRAVPDVEKRPHLGGPTATAPKQSLGARERRATARWESARATDERRPYASTMRAWRSCAPAEAGRLLGNGQQRRARQRAEWHDAAEAGVAAFIGAAAGKGRLVDVRCGGGGRRRFRDDYIAAELVRVISGRSRRTAQGGGGRQTAHREVVWHPAPRDRGASGLMEPLDVPLLGGDGAAQRLHSRLRRLHRVAARRPAALPDAPRRLAARGVQLLRLDVRERGQVERAARQWSGGSRWAEQDRPCWRTRRSHEDDKPVAARQAARAVERRLNLDVRRRLRALPRRRGPADLRRQLKNLRRWRQRWVEHVTRTAWKSICVFLILSIATQYLAMLSIRPRSGRRRAAGRGHLDGWWTSATARARARRACPSTRVPRRARAVVRAVQLSAVDDRRRCPTSRRPISSAISASTAACRRRT